MFQDTRPFASIVGVELLVEPEKMNIAILLPAAGLGRRMGGTDKLLEPVDGLPLLRRQVLRALAASPLVFVTLPDPAGPRAEALAGLAVHRIAVPDNADGMSASLRRAALALPADTAVMVVPADMPDLTTEDFRKLMGVLRSSPEAIVQGHSADGKAGHPVLFPPDCVAEFATLSGDRGARAILEAHRARVRAVPLPARNALVDLDTPEAWARWRSARDLTDERRN